MFVAFFDCATSWQTTINVVEVSIFYPYFSNERAASATSGCPTQFLVGGTKPFDY
jgi:hypothetical protein